MNYKAYTVPRYILYVHVIVKPHLILKNTGPKRKKEKEKRRLYTLGTL